MELQNNDKGWMDMKKHYKEIVKACDRSVHNYMKMTVTETDDPDFGGIRGDDGMVTPGASIGCVLGYASSYYCADSEYFKDPEVLEYMETALEYSKKIQREDGTFDLLISNFYSAPDTGFIMHNIAHTYRVMDKYAETKAELKLRDKLYSILEKASRGLRDGGFHTPNHRWVEAAGLAMAYNITGDESLLEMTHMYLAEGIDIDENGEFTERSPGIYNAVNDNALIILAEELGLPELMNHAAKNLRMMFSYFEPDGSVFTQNSVRVDKGEGMPGKSFYPMNYYYLYLYLAYSLNDSDFASMANLMFEGALRSGRAVPGVLWMYMLEAGLVDYEPDTNEIPLEYEVHYKPSRIVRKRKGDLTATILGGSPNFLFVQKGSLRCYVRICSSFFAVAQFKADEIKRNGNLYEMEFTAKAGYRWPLETPPETSVWDEMDHTKRKSVNNLSLSYNVKVELTETGARLHIKTTGCDRVPLKVEFCLTGGCLLKGDNFHVQGKPGNAITIGDGMVDVSLGLDKMKIGPAFMQHWYDSDMRGSAEQDKNGFTVYFTEYTNIDKTVEIITQ